MAEPAVSLEHTNGTEEWSCKVDVECFVRGNDVGSSLLGKSVKKNACYWQMTPESNVHKFIWVFVLHGLKNTPLQRIVSLHNISSCLPNHLVSTILRRDDERPLYLAEAGPVCCSSTTAARLAPP